MKRRKKSDKQKLQKEADSLLTPLIIKLHPKCLLCGHPTQVAHHHIKKSESNRLRYVVDNLINLCTKCHCALHSHETIWSNKIIKIKGQEWHDNLMKIKQEFCKVDKQYYLNAIEKLKN
jgi:5-methylcytosine-specific restriction endonuclease McrA